MNLLLFEELARGSCPLGPSDYTFSKQLQEGPPIQQTE